MRGYGVLSVLVFAACSGAAPSGDDCKGVALPAEQHWAAQGLCVRMVAASQGALQQLSFEGGDLLGMTVEGEVRRYRDLDADGFFASNTAEIETVARSLGRPPKVIDPRLAGEEAEPMGQAPLDREVDALPARYAGGVFVALHGSYDLDPPTGSKVIWMARDASAEEVVFGGGTQEAPRDGYWSWGEGGLGESLVRPVGVAISPIDGALYVSSDNASVAFGPDFEPNGAIYRIALARRQ